jgi:hypothetical protein
MSGESIDHLLLHIEIVGALWNSISIFLGYIGLCLDEWYKSSPVGKSCLIVLIVMQCESGYQPT